MSKVEKIVQRNIPGNAGVWHQASFRKLSKYNISTAEPFALRLQETPHLKHLASILDAFSEWAKRGRMTEVCVKIIPQRWVHKSYSSPEDFDK